MGVAARADRVAVAVGRGLAAGVVGTAAMTAASTLEMKLRGRAPSMAPAQVAAKVLGVEPANEQRFGTVAHLVMGVSLGAVRGLIDVVGLRGPAAAGLNLAVAWLPDLVVVPAFGAAEPPWKWGATETAISGLHHAVYAGAMEPAYRALVKA